MFFSRNQVVLWPKSQTLDVYFDKKDNNNLSFEINLWSKLSESDLTSIKLFVRQNKIDTVSVLVPDDIVLTKSFLYDSQISSIEKKEVISLAESFVPFKIEPSALEYKLVKQDQKTIIQAKIYDKTKIENLNANVAAIGLEVSRLVPVSESISSVISTFYNKEYFLIYQNDTNSSEYVLLLSKADSVYLTSIIKGKSLDIQKIINYSNLYFTETVTKLFYPQDRELEIVSTSQLDKTEFKDERFPLEFKKASNLPLPVLGILIDSKPKTADIINIMPTENNTLSPKLEEKSRKNILPLISAFVLTAALASIGIWFVLNRNPQADLESPAGDQDLAATTPTESLSPTSTPTPTVAPVSKDIKIQVLNATSINGQAALLKSTLAEMGFTDISVGNSKENLTGNEIKLKPELSSSSAYFKQALATEFPATYEDSLEPQSNYDVVFLIGTDIRNTTSSQTATTTPSVTPKVTSAEEE